MALLTLREFLSGPDQAPFLPTLREATADRGRQSALREGVPASARVGVGIGTGQFPTLRQFLVRSGDLGSREAFPPRALAAGPGQGVVRRPASAERPADPLRAIRTGFGLGAELASLPNLPARFTPGEAPLSPASVAVSNALAAAGLLADLPLTLTGPGSPARKTLATARDIAGLTRLAATVPAVREALPAVAQAAPFATPAASVLNLGLGALDLSEGRLGAGVGEIAGAAGALLLPPPFNILAAIALPFIGGSVGGVLGGEDKQQKAISAFHEAATRQVLETVLPGIKSGAIQPTAVIPGALVPITAGRSVIEILQDHGVPNAQALANIISAVGRPAPGGHVDTSAGEIRLNALRAIAAASRDEQYANFVTSQIPASLAEVIRLETGLTVGPTPEPIFTSAEGVGGGRIVYDEFGNIIQRFDEFGNIISFGGNGGGGE